MADVHPALRSAADPLSNWTPEQRQAHFASADEFFNSLLESVLDPLRHFHR